MAENKKKRTMLKVGILSLSVLLQVGGAMSVAIAAIAASYKTQSVTSVQALATIPSFAIMLFVLLDTWFVKKIGKRNTVFLGLTLALVGGVGPALINNFLIVQILRFVLGAGIGLFTPLAVSLIGDFFVGDEQKNLLGIQSAMSTFGNSFATFLAGLLLAINWHATYYVYLMAVPVFILFIIGYPKHDVNASEQENSESAEAVNGNKKLPGLVIVGMLTLFVYFIAVMAWQTNSALALKALNVPNAGFLGTAMAISGLIGAVVVALYGPLFKVFKHFLPILIMIVGAIGFIGMAHVTSMMMFMVFSILTSATSLIIPYVYGTVLDSAPAASKNLAISMAMVLNNLGAFSSPYILGLIGRLIGKTDSISSFYIAAVLMVFLAVVFVFIWVARRRQTDHTVAKA